MITNGWFVLALVAAAAALWLVVGLLNTGRQPEPEHGMTEAEFTALAADVPPIRKSIARHRRKARARAVKP